MESDRLIDVLPSALCAVWAGNRTPCAIGRFPLDRAELPAMVLLVVGAAELCAGGVCLTFTGIVEGSAVIPFVAFWGNCHIDPSRSYCRTWPLQSVPAGISGWVTRRSQGSPPRPGPAQSRPRPLPREWRGLNSSPRFLWRACELQNLPPLFRVRRSHASSGSALQRFQPSVSILVFMVGTVVTVPSR